MQRRLSLARFRAEAAAATACPVRYLAPHTSPLPTRRLVRLWIYKMDDSCEDSSATQKERDDIANLLVCARRESHTTLAKRALSKSRAVGAVSMCIAGYPYSPSARYGRFAQALPCHIIEEGAAELTAGDECSLCLSVIAEGDSLRTLPCRQCATTGHDACAHSLHEMRDPVAFPL